MNLESVEFVKLDDVIAIICERQKFLCPFGLYSKRHVNTEMGQVFWDEYESILNAIEHLDKYYKS